MGIAVRDAGKNGAQKHWGWMEDLETKKSKKNRGGYKP
jgi:hypothetical protein